MRMASKIILKWILRVEYTRVWSEFVSLRIVPYYENGFEDNIKMNLKGTEHEGVVRIRVAPNTTLL